MVYQERSTKIDIRIEFFFALVLLVVVVVVVVAEGFIARIAPPRCI